MRERAKAGAAMKIAKRAATCVVAGWIACTLLQVSALFSPAFAQEVYRPDIVIVRPAPDPAYNEIFDAIENGIANRASIFTVNTLNQSGSSSTDSLREDLTKLSPKVVITLGGQATEAYRKAGLSIPHIIGGLNLPPAIDEATGVSLTADPVFLLGRLQALMPDKKRIVVVVDPKKDEWLRNRAQEVAVSLGQTLVVYEANTLAEASTHYWNILKYGNPETDVLWLLSNPSFVSDSNLPRLVEESWRRNFAIISSNIDHARRGALIATYPDLEAMGAQLADLARDTVESPNRRQPIEPLGAVKFAVNKRIANHLGIALSVQDERKFDLILGER